MIRSLGVALKPAIVAVLVSMVVVVAAGTVIGQLSSQTRADLDQQLQATLEGSIFQVKRRLDERKTAVYHWANEPELIQSIEALLGKDSTIATSVGNEIDERLVGILKHGYNDYKLLDKQGRVLASHSGRDIGQTLPMDELDEFIFRAWQGSVEASHPFIVSRAWKNKDGGGSEGLPVMLILAPVVGKNKETISLLAFELDPDDIFIPSFHYNQVGKTGETYGLNRDGMLLTESKYSAQLREIGLLTEDIRHSDLHLMLIDPGINLVTYPSAITNLSQNRPLTEMAQAISRGEQGSNLTGYADYRGVPVIGAWRWDEGLQMGIATETDVDEAFALYQKTVINIQIGVTSVLVFILLATILYSRSVRQGLYLRHQRDAIINNTAEGLITIDARGLMTIVNPSAAKMFGYDVDEMVGKNVSMLLPREERAAHDVYIRNSTIHEPMVLSKVRELSGCRKDGSLFPIELTVSPMKLGEDKYFVGILRDITDRYQQQQALRDAKDLAEQANKAKSEFLSSMSHELRTPLNSVLGFSQLLSVDELTEDQRESVAMISRSGKHLLDLINDVLDLSQIESGKVDLSLRAVNIRQLIAEIEPFLKTQLPQLRLTLTSEYFSQSDIWVMADYMKLKQVLLNLLSNAAKYNRPHGHIIIAISQQKTDKVRISVRDTGYGIEEKYKQTLFEPFNRLGKENSDIQGTGIGLTISRELTTLMHGDLGFESTKAGSVFWVELPIAEQPLGYNINNESTAEERDTMTEQGKIIKVLYIEDNPANMMLVRRLLMRHSQYQLLEAETAEEGIEMARKVLPSIVLMDINLPGMNGFEALEIMKREGLTEKMAIVALSANALVTEVERGHYAGFDAYLTKPVDFTELMDTLQNMAER
ncbi:MAG: PAS domain S-box protein [Gammaproteobacteria bacterium]|nr:PAS domain S-box protein [Gammaproteobacteria bacterium]